MKFLTFLKGKGNFCKYLFGIEYYVLFMQHFKVFSVIYFWKYISEAKINLAWRFFKKKGNESNILNSKTIQNN